MVTSTVAHQVDTHSVRLTIHGEATIDLGNHPDYPRTVPVTEIAVIYTTTQSADSASGPRTEVTSIAYVLDNEEDKTAFVHPDFLDQPDAWPEWVRTLIDQYRPTVRARQDSCPECGAPAVGTRIPEHKPTCPRLDPHF
ncbi:MAG: hypothetical protein HOY79_04560 [Streptomyces sp.]|nr:hypothetical protein [Streptomyces sp.]NUS15477.1 hypothetical protein [Streptomyces sp.]NUS24064.1 hypothetical protein [Streptomyces sp.]